MPLLNVKPLVVEPDLFADPDKWADALAWHQGTSRLGGEAYFALAMK